MGEPETNDYDYENEDEGYLPMTIGLLVPSAVGISVLIILTIIGNVLTIIAFLRDKRLHTVYDLYIFNLAITDLLIGLSSMPFYAVYTLREFVWDFGPAYCKVWLCIDFTLCLESVLMIVILSFDRLQLLRYGPHYTTKVTLRKAVIQVAVSWVMAFLLYCPAIIGWDYWVGYSTVRENDCDTEFAYNFEYTTATAFVEFLIPLFALIIINFLIYRKIFSRLKAKNKVKPLVINTKKAVIPADNVPEGTENQNVPSTSAQVLEKGSENGKNSQEQLQTRRENKAARFLAALVLVFLVCWLPYTLFTIIVSFCEEGCVNLSLYESMNWLLWGKSAINPLLYAMNNERYKSNFKRLIFWWRKKVPSIRTIDATENTVM